MDGYKESLEVNTVKLIKNTGISSQDYPYRESKEEMDDFFLSKAHYTIEQVNLVRGEQQSKHGYNVSCVNLPIPIDDTTMCDYLSYKRENRWFHCKVVDREFVNVNATRFHFIIDYVASYWDTLELGNCLIERTHVIEDELGEFWNHSFKQYHRLPEPIYVISYPQPEYTKENSSKQCLTNVYTAMDDVKLFLNASVNKEGKFTNNGLQIVSGNGNTGFLYSYNKNDNSIIDDLNSYYTFSNQMISENSAFASTIDWIILAPTKSQIVNEENSMFLDTFDINTILDKDKMVKSDGSKLNIRHRKTLQYIGIKLFNSYEETYIDSKSTNLNMLKVASYMSGGVGGYLTVRVAKGDGNDYPTYLTNVPVVDLNTPSWATYGLTGIIKSVDYEFNFSRPFKHVYNSLMEIF